MVDDMEGLAAKSCVPCRGDLVLWTHKIGGLHENDFILAAKINRLLEEGDAAELAG